MYCPQYGYRVPGRLPCAALRAARREMEMLIAVEVEERMNRSVSILSIVYCTVGNLDCSWHQQPAGLSISIAIVPVPVPVRTNQFILYIYRFPSTQQAFDRAGPQTQKVVFQNFPSLELPL